MHWIRDETAPSMLPAIARASTVFAVPGHVLEAARGRRTTSAASTRRISSRLPWTTVSMFASSRSAMPTARAKSARAASVSCAVIPTILETRLCYPLQPSCGTGSWGRFSQQRLLRSHSWRRKPSRRAAAPARWIVFSAHPDSDGATQPAQLFRVPSTGGTPEQITKGRLIATQPAFSPDGKTIVFQRLGSGLFRMNLDGSGLKRLTSHGRDAYPVFSRDGKKIAFIRLKGTDWRLHVMSATGANEHLLPKAVPAGRPTWSADGKSIYAPAAADLYRLDARTGAIQKTYGILLDLQTMQTLTVSPNFRTIAYIGPRVSTGPDDCGEGPCPQYGLYLANVAKPHRSRKIVNDTSPAGWSPDGKTLAFVSRGALNLYDVATGRRTLISTARAHRPGRLVARLAAEVA